MKGYVDSNNPFSKENIAVFKTVIRDSRYYLEALYNNIESGNASVPLMGWTNDTDDFCYLFNPNLFQYILENGLYARIFEKESVYKKRFVEGTESYARRFGSASPNSHKTWNSLITIYRDKIKKELLDDRIVFTEEEILNSFFISGMASKYVQFEEDNSIALAAYFSLQATSSKYFMHAKIPIINRYNNTMQRAAVNETKVIPKVEFIVLKEIGYVDLLIVDNTSKEAATLIAQEINNTYKLHGEMKCSVINIQNILSVDSYVPDYESRKSAYKKNNIRKAIVKLSAMGFTLEDCKYLNTIKEMKPDWFD